MAMTKREMLVAVAEGRVDEEVMAKAAELIATMDAEGEKRRKKAAEKRAEKLEGERVLEEGILAVLSHEEPMTASDIKGAVEGIETPQKATAVVKRLVGAGLVTSQEVKGKSGKVKGYTLV